MLGTPSPRRGPGERHKRDSETIWLRKADIERALTECSARRVPELIEAGRPGISPVFVPIRDDLPTFSRTSHEQCRPRSCSPIVPGCKSRGSTVRSSVRVDLRAQSCGFLNYRITYTQLCCEDTYANPKHADLIDSRGDDAGGVHSPGVLPAAVDHDDDNHQLPAGTAASERWDVPLKLARGYRSALPHVSQQWKPVAATLRRVEAEEPTSPPGAARE